MLKMNYFDIKEVKKLSKLITVILNYFKYQSKDNPV